MRSQRVELDECPQHHNRHAQQSDRDFERHQVASDRERARRESVLLTERHLAGAHSGDYEREVLYRQRMREKFGYNVVPVSPRCNQDLVRPGWLVAIQATPMLRQNSTSS
ncbi:Uncharacterised protein [Mycobacteroides abscessus subsp. abscessus]|nr:Uncharacterised protein [Mycobacteroides abscessus subsp. abscessus]